MSVVTDDAATTPDVHDSMAAARLAGYSWDDINGHLDNATDQALAAGYTQDDIDKHLGYRDPAPLTSRLTNAALEQTVQAPDKDLVETASHGFDPETGIVPPELRQSYANALQSGEAIDPTDFAASWQDALHNVTGENAPEAPAELAASLPSNEDFTDHAIAAAHASGQEPSVPLVRITKDNLVEHYAATGEPPQVALQRAQADPNFADAITSPQPETPWQKIENAVTGFGSWLNQKPDMTTPDAVGKAFTSAFENLGGTHEEYVSSLLASVSPGLADAVASTTRGVVGAVEAPFAVLQGTIMGVIASTVGEVGSAVHMTEADKDRTMRDALGLIQSFGADAPNMTRLIEKPTIPEIFEYAETGIHPEARRLIAEQAPDIIAPIEEKAKAGEPLPEAAPEWAHDLHEQLTPEEKQPAPYALHEIGRDELTDHPDGPHTAISYDIKDAQGNITGEANVQKFPDGTARVQNIEANGVTSEGTPNSLGPSAVRGLLRQFREENPDVTKLSGNRISGARQGGVYTEGAQSEVEVNLPPEAHEQLAGELTGRMLDERQAGWLRSLLQDESGSVPLPNFARWSTPDEFTEKIRSANFKEQARGEVQKLTGLSYRENQAAWQQLEEHFKTVEKLVPEYKQELSGIKAAGSDILNRYDPLTGQTRDRSALGQLDDWMDKRFVGDEPTPDHPLFPAFQSLRQGAGIMRAEIERRGPDAVQNFIEHYLARQYKDPDRFSNDVVGKQGSLANTQRRSIPTHTEAIERGHDPLYYNPLERQLHYNQSMRAFLDQDNMVNSGIDSEAAYYATRPQNKRDVMIDGRSSRRNIDIGMTQAQAKRAVDIADRGMGSNVYGKEVPGTSEPHILRGGGKGYSINQPYESDLEGRPYHIPYGVTLDQIRELANNGVISQQLYANRGWGSVYNRYYSTGFGKYGPGARSLYEKMLFASNASVAAKLGLSLYHFGDIVQESYSTAISRALNGVAHGDLSWQMLGDLVGAPVSYYRRGKMRQDEYLRSPNEREWANMNNGAAASYEEKMARLAGGSGLRPVGRTQEYMVGHLTNLFSAVSRGTYGRELREGIAHITEDTGDMPPIRKGAVMGARGVGFAVSEAGRVLNAAMTPLFDKFVPRVKYAAWTSEMGDWLKRNPGASEENALAYGRKLSNSMDDRFGEMVQDNLHWNKILRQTLNVATVSVGWEYGTLRAFGNVLNAKDAEKRMLSTRWLAGFMGATGILNSAYQYLMTGHGPSSLKDLAAPRTGGTTPEGKPERGLLPGYQKDPIQWWIHLADARDPVQFSNGIRTLMGNKANNFIGLLSHWMDSPDLAHYFAKVKEDYKPINADPIKNLITGGKAGRLRGDAIPEWQKALGLARPVSAAIEDPERAAAQKKRQALSDKQKEDAIERARNRRMEAPDPEVEQRTSAELKEVAAQLRSLLSGGGGGGGGGRWGASDAAQHEARSARSASRQAAGYDTGGIIAAGGGKGSTKAGATRNQAARPTIAGPSGGIVAGGNKKGQPTPQQEDLGLTLAEDTTQQQQPLVTRNPRQARAIRYAYARRGRS